MIGISCDLNKAHRYCFCVAVIKEEALQFTCDRVFQVRSLRNAAAESPLINVIWRPWYIQMQIFYPCCVKEPL